jgi:hypothetical protein
MQFKIKREAGLSERATMWWSKLPPGDKRAEFNISLNYPEWLAKVVKEKFIREFGFINSITTFPQFDNDNWNLEICAVLDDIVGVPMDSIIEIDEKQIDGWVRVHSGLSTNKKNFLNRYLCPVRQGYFIAGGWFPYSLLEKV